MIDIPAGAGLCADCRYAKPNRTERGSVFLRCLRAAWDTRLVRYPRLPVVACVGFESHEGEL